MPLNFNQSLLSIIISSQFVFFKTKKGKVMLLLGTFYGFFLSINSASTIATTMIRTNSPAIAGTKYMLATDVGVAVGAGVAGAAGSTSMWVSAYEP